MFSGGCVNIIQIPLFNSNVCIIGSLVSQCRQQQQLFFFPANFCAFDERLNKVIINIIIGVVISEHTRDTYI